MEPDNSGSRKAVTMTIKQCNVLLVSPHVIFVDERLAKGSITKKTVGQKSCPNNNQKSQSLSSRSSICYASNEIPRGANLIEL